MNYWSRLSFAAQTSPVGRHRPLRNPSLRVASITKSVALWMLVAAVLAGSRPSIAAEALRASSIILILDCSKSMGGAFALRDDVTRLGRAKEILDAQMHEAAAAGGSRIGFYCLGHRLRWQEGVDKPDLQPQDGYLQASLGYGALRTLLPGDDIERLLGLRPFDDIQAALLVPGIRALEAWGERPVNLALIKALDELSSETSASKAIVLLTDGGPSSAKGSVDISQEMVVDALKHCLTPIYVIDLGDNAETEPSQCKLREIAELGGGTIVKAPSTEPISLVSLLRQSQLAALGKTDTGEPVTAGHRQVGARRLNSYRVLGKVVYYGRPVSAARISLSGAESAADQG